MESESLGKRLPDRVVGSSPMCSVGCGGIDHTAVSRVDNTLASRLEVIRIGQETVSKTVAANRHVGSNPTTSVEGIGLPSN